MDVVPTKPGLFRVPGVPAYLLAAGFARIADEMVQLTIVLLVMARTGNAVLAGVVVAAYTLPAVVSGPLLGAWLDRARHQRLALAGNGVLLAAVCVGLVAATGRAPDALVVALASLAGFALPMTSGGYSSLVPRFVPPSLAPTASALDAGVFNVATIAGPALAGVLAATAGPAMAMLAVACLACTGAACTVLLPDGARVGGGGQRKPLRAEVGRGFRHLAGTPPLRGGTVTTVLSLGAVGTLAIALPAHTANLGSGPESAGYLWTSIEAGCLVTTALIGRHLRRWRPERVVFLCVALYGTTMATWPLAGGLWPLLALGFLAGLAEGSTLPAIIATRRQYTPDELLARVSMTGASLKIGAFALGGLAGGWLVPALGSSATILVVAVAQLAAAGLGLLSARDW